VNAASQQRRPLSFREGLLEIKKSMGKGAQQTPEEPRQTREEQPARKSREPAALAQDARPENTKNRPSRARRPQQAGEPAQGGKPRQTPQTRAPKSGEPPAQSRQRPDRKPAPPAVALSDAEKMRIERNRQLNTVWNLFAKHHPAFRDRLPLKIGVAEDLIARHADYERALIVAVLKRHVNHPRYHERVAAGGARYELDGSESAGPGIEASHISRANMALSRQKARAAARAQEKAAGSAQPQAQPTETPLKPPPAQPEPPAESA
jgi:hypothetical protein